MHALNLGEPSGPIPYAALSAILEGSSHRGPRPTLNIVRITLLSSKAPRQLASTSWWLHTFIVASVCVQQRQTGKGWRLQRQRRHTPARQHGAIHDAGLVQQAGGGLIGVLVGGLAVPVSSRSDAGGGPRLLEAARHTHTSP